MTGNDCVEVGEFLEINLCDKYLITGLVLMRVPNSGTDMCFLSYHVMIMYFLLHYDYFE